MASVVTNFTKSVLNRLESITDTQSLPIFNTINIFNNQINRMEDGSGYSFNYPAVFVETEIINTERYGMGYNAYDVWLIIHLVDEMLDDTLGNLDRNIQVFEYRDLVIQSIDGWSATQSGTILYENGKQDYDHTNLYHYVLNFKAHIVDPTSNKMPIEGTGTYSINSNWTWQSNNYGVTGSATFSLIITN